ncbi:MAG TPA: hypothetical protein ENO11_00950 [Desulfobacteraceae bacterium]|nr:hypothetical protein [Desulfobacteraceae bacterium]
MKKIICILASVLFLFGLGACSDESREFTMHEPGVYKGDKDPLLAKDRHQELNDRFMKVQTDR